MPATLEQSFMKAVFHGVIAEDMIFPFPETPKEERENVVLMLDSVRRFFAAHVDSAKIDREHEIPPSVLAGLKELGLFGLQIGSEHGGIGLSTHSYLRVMQEGASRDSSIAVTLGAHQSIGLKALLLFGTSELKQRYLPALATGEKVVVFYASANRDETVFSDPDTFDIGRSPNEHVAFGGGGVHFCLGANLARVEIRALFTEVLSRLHDMELAGPVERLRSNFINGPRHMPVRFRAH